ncbi:BfmA/BtgA family mobilization protein [Robertkochia solimangrovi]|uniref:BfmA/BtgA family mobilization protein n=1 Tax=Robertkochia solimangrovi TaxID=2213046 RepID=UPI00117CFBFB|nr:BfmA/BtgA family mobilization protein [Robertkochia solimangrovi]TRZ42468.1 hypothetical protein DMZ48_13235 [Robertkochia solimangrovi]
MKDSYQKYRFSGISIKKDIADRFRKYSGEISKSHTETLEAMLNFFKWNQLSPYENLGVRFDSTKKRINALIAIIKNIEKQQTLPTKAMLDTLFQQINQMEDNEENQRSFDFDSDENFDFEPAEAFTRDSELELYQNRYEQLKQQLSSYHHTVADLLDKISYVKNSFGKDYHKLVMDKNEFENFKKQLDHVYHHYRPES